MSSSNDLFGPEDFENLIAAVDSLEIPLDDDSSSPSQKQSTINSQNISKRSQPAFEAKGNPFGGGDSLAMESNEDNEFAEFEDLNSEYSELNFDDGADNSDTFTATTSFAAKQPQKSQFNIDDPAQLRTAEQSTVNKQDINDEDDLVDMYAAFLEATEDDPRPIEPGSVAEKRSIRKNDLDDEFSEFVGIKEHQPAQEKPVNYFQFDDEEETELFDGVAAANEIARIWLDEKSERKASSAASKSTEPLMDSITKTKMAADKLKAHLESLSAKSKNKPEDKTNAAPKQQNAQFESVEETKPAAIDPEFAELATQAELTQEVAEPLHLEFDGEFADLASQADSNSSLLEPAHLEAEGEFAELAFQAELTPGIAEPMHLESDGDFADLASQADSNSSLLEPAHLEVEGEFAELASQAATTNPEINPQLPPESVKAAASVPVSDKLEGTVNLSKKTEVISDNMLAAFVESTLSSKQKIRMLSAQNFARKFPRTYLGCTTLLALVGFAYILAIPVLLVVTMFNGFEMLNSPFTNNTVMLLVALFSISLFMFMVTYKLFDLKFVGPGGITLNHENAAELINKIQQLKNDAAIPNIHEIVLTRRHELNIIKVPRFGVPIWSKNILAIGYPLLQTLPAEYFDVALVRRLTQFNKRKNMLHNWLSFMRRTWTMYAVSLKERKNVIDLLHYCFFAPYASMYRSFAVYVSQKDELMSDEKALHYCNDRDLVKTAQTLRITRAMLVQYFWPKLNEDLQHNTAAPHYVQPYSKLPETLNTLLRSKNVDSWFIRLGQEDMNPGDPEAPFALRMQALGQRKVAIPDAFESNAAEHYFGDKYEKMTDLLNTLWAEEVQKELFEKKIHKGGEDVELPCHLAIEPA